MFIHDALLKNPTMYVSGLSGLLNMDDRGGRDPRPWDDVSLFMPCTVLCLLDAIVAGTGFVDAEVVDKSDSWKGGR